MAGIAGHAAKGDGEAGGNEEDGEHLHQVREGGGVLEGVGAVGVEEASAVGAEHLDGFLRGDGALGDGLAGRGGICPVLGYMLSFDEFGGVVGAEVLDDTLRDEEEGVDEAAGE